MEPSGAPNALAGMTVLLASDAAVNLTGQALSD